MDSASLWALLFNLARDVEHNLSRLPSREALREETHFKHQDTYFLASGVEYKVCPPHFITFERVVTLHRVGSDTEQDLRVAMTLSKSQGDELNLMFRDTTLRRRYSVKYREDGTPTRYWCVYDRQSIEVPEMAQWITEQIAERLPSELTAAYDGR